MFRFEQTEKLKFHEDPHPHRRSTTHTYCTYEYVNTHTHTHTHSEGLAHVPHLHIQIALNVASFSFVDRLIMPSPSLPSSRRPV